MSSIPEMPSTSKCADCVHAVIYNYSSTREVYCKEMHSRVYDSNKKAHIMSCTSAMTKAEAAAAAA